MINNGFFFVNKIATMNILCGYFTVILNKAISQVYFIKPVVVYKIIKFI
ncbi:hypothetical protein PROVRETT_07210 [Providencia rettgeri DSM 1131]|nr:hypothetical protein PROVRETT_07210 [Providencia rettgeri DSM 1131]